MRAIRDIKNFSRKRPKNGSV